MNKESFIEELRKMSPYDRRNLINDLRNSEAELDAAEEKNQWKTFGNLAGELSSQFEKMANSPLGFEGKAAIKEVKDSMGEALDELGSAISNFGSWAGGEKDSSSNESDSDSSSKNEEDLAKGQGDKEESSPSYDVDEMAGEFILGAWGNGQDRIDNMINAGYSIDDYNKIQQRVNEAYESGRDLHEWTNKANEKLHYW